MTAVFVSVGLAALLALLILLGGLLRVPGFQPRFVRGPGSAALPEPAPLYVNASRIGELPISPPELTLHVNPAALEA